MNTANDVAPLRIFLFKRQGTDVLQLRHTIGSACRGSLVNALDQSEGGTRIACALLRSGGPFPALILVLQPERNDASVETIRRIRGTPELRALPLAILGDPEDFESALNAYLDGADEFVPLSECASRIGKLGREVVRSWSKQLLSKSAG